MRRPPASAPATPSDHDQAENPEDARAHSTAHGDDAEALARWLAETLAEAPPVPKAATALIAGVLARRSPPDPSPE